MSTAARVFGIIVGTVAVAVVLVAAAPAERRGALRPLLPDINGIYGDGWTALMDAAWSGNFARVQELLDKGADVNIKGNHGWTALMGPGTSTLHGCL